MTYDFNIMTLDTEARRHYVRGIRSALSSGKWNEVFIPTVNGSDGNLTDALDVWGLSVPQGTDLGVGEVGVWLSVFERWEWCIENEKPLLVLEDDAILDGDFESKFERLLEELPEDADYIQLWIPENQHQDYLYLAEYTPDGSLKVAGNLPEELCMYDYGGDRLVRIYPGYGNVAMYYTPKGARKLIDLSREDGLFTPVDCFQCLQSHWGRCFGYAPRPQFATLVSYDWPQTTINKKDRY